MSESPEQKARSDRPAAPRARPVAPAQPPSGALDDDSVIAPAPPLEVFLPRRGAGIPTRKPILRSSLGGRRTLIPILLTNGVLLPTLGALWFATETDSPLRRPGVWLPISLISIGIILLLLGLANAFFVRHQLSRGRN